eukprot:SAG31_NODE_2341_length_5913_cov_2.173689_4_plen_52_part_00
MPADEYEVTLEIDPGNNDPYELLHKLRSGLADGPMALGSGQLKSVRSERVR